MAKFRQTMTTVRSTMTLPSSSVVQQASRRQHSHGGDELIVGWPAQSSSSDGDDDDPTIIRDDEHDHDNDDGSAASAVSSECPRRSKDENSMAVPPVVAAAKGARRRRVSFSPSTEVLWHHTVDDMTLEEIDAAWYTDAENTKIKKEARTSIQYLLLLSRKLASDPPAATPQQVSIGKKLCVRGLEHMLDADTLRELKESKDGVVKAVLVAQDEEDFEHSDDEERDSAIASACVRASAAARALAHEAGARDQEFVIELRRKERAKLLRRARRVASGRVDDDDGSSSSDERPHVQPFFVDASGGGGSEDKTTTKTKTLAPAGGFRSAYQQAIGAGFFGEMRTRLD